MGRDKSRLRFGKTTMLGQIRRTARATGLPVRVIRRDCVPKCGPLGGVYTALKSTKADAILFLACDMPLVSTELIQLVLQYTAKGSAHLSTGSWLQPASHSLFVHCRGRTGFPFILPRSSIAAVAQQLKVCDLSLQTLAKVVDATIFAPTSTWSRLLFNVNTQSDWEAIARRLKTGRHATSRRLS